MPELSIPYELTLGGVRVVFGNADAAKADPDYIGWLDPEQGITGLLDTADSRVSADDRVDGDGGFHGPFWRGRRTGTINLFIDPDPANLVESRISKLKQASRGLREDALLQWTPSVDGIRRQLRLRREQAVRVQGRRPKQVQLGLASADHRITSAVEQQAIIVPGGGAGELGFGDPFSDPFGSQINVAGQVFVTNLGDETATPRFRIDGPITNPRVRNHTVGLEVRFLVTLAAGEFLTVDTRVPSVLLNGSADTYASYDFANSSWWELDPAQNDVRLLADNYATGAQLTVWWRHSFE